MIASPKNQGHVWADLEPDFQLSLAAHRSHPCCPFMLAESQRRIVQRATGSAIQIFHNWGKSAAFQEGEDAAAEWLLQLYQVIYARYELGRPIHRYAYGALKLICMASSRRTKQFIELSHEDTIEGAFHSPLLESITDEQYSMLSVALGDLSSLEQQAIQSQLNFVDSLEPPINQSAKKNYSASYRAKKKLADRFRDYRNLDR